MKNNKKIYVIIELMYLLINALLLITFKASNNINTIYDNHIFACLFVLLVFIVWIMPSPVNKIATLLYLVFIFGYIDAQNGSYAMNGTYFAYRGFDFFCHIHNYFFIIVGILVSAVFIVLYIIYQRKIIPLRMNISFRLLGLLIIYTIPLQIKAYEKKISDLKKETPIYELQNYSYYSFLHLEDSANFVDNFGLLSYLYEDMKDYQYHRKHEDKAIKNINAVLENKPLTSSNIHTGIFEGKNLILIQSSLLNGFNINNTLTPTLYKMMNEGICVNNFKTPMLSGFETDTEFMTNTSLVPNSSKDNIFYTNPNNKWGLTLAEMFKSDGYNTSFYYGNYGTYYNRYNVYRNFGYDNIFYNIDIGEEEIVDDVKMAETIAWISGPSSVKNMNYWIANSNSEDVEVNNNDVDYAKSYNPDYSDEEAIFMARTINFDRAMNSLINNLDIVGALDKTVIMIYDDGMAKDYSMNPGNAFAGQLIIYGNEVIAEKYNKVSTCLDIMPTLANLFNISYDQHQIIGSDIFDDNYRGFFFNDSIVDEQPWRTNDYVFNYKKGRFGELQIPYKEAMNDIKKKEKMINTSYDIIKYNYFDNNH